MVDLAATLESAFAGILRISLQASLLVLIIVGSQRLLRDRISPAWRHAFWGLLLVKLLLVWTVPAPFSVNTLVSRVLTNRSDVGLSIEGQAPSQTLRLGGPVTEIAPSGLSGMSHRRTFGFNSDSTGPTTSSTLRTDPSILTIWSNFPGSPFNSFSSSVSSTH